ncbi:hypothetical protein LX16_1990 [Stackebrandtia albiflava]|uniref:Uncharacterized protein n=1 Tax=Stackebrandtia albiflava TaxID=406432 RepID=A0A562VEE9_9ACTN|nr:hypothetical protein [Stackebrandtia albiflava]TWJ16263.1 hypothetical protein LX16_1990 [Stackebrandtia albiflava]
MFLESDFDRISDDATPAQISTHLESLGRGEHAIAILGTAPQEYIQTCFLPQSDAFSLEFRDGDCHRHYTFTTTSRALLDDAFLSYHAGDNRWKTMVEWRRDPHYETVQAPEGVTAPVGDLTLLVFTAETDLSSRVYRRQLAEIVALTTGRLRVEVVDVAESPGRAAEWGVTGEHLPIQLVIDGGVLRRVLCGVRSRKAMLRELAEHLDRPS